MARAGAAHGSQGAEDGGHGGSGGGDSPAAKLTCGSGCLNLVTPSYRERHALRAGQTSQTTNYGGKMYAADYDRHARRPRA
jgi:hypothetical protein